MAPDLALFKVAYYQLWQEPLHYNVTMFNHVPQYWTVPQPFTFPLKIEYQFHYRDTRSQPVCVNILSMQREQKSIYRDQQTSRLNSWLKQTQARPHPEQPLFTRHNFSPSLFLLRLIEQKSFKKDFPSERGHHPSSSFIVLQCYTRGNPFKARERRLGKRLGKRRHNVVLLRQTWRPPTGLWWPWLFQLIHL